MKTVFADSFYYLALLCRDDEGHGAAVSLSRDLRCRTTTTAGVLTEVGDALASTRQRELFSDFVRQLRNDRLVDVIEADRALFDRGTALYSRRPDKEWPLTDCISFVVMQDGGLTEALTGDHHFQQAGFQALLLGD